MTAPDADGGDAPEDPTDDLDRSGAPRAHPAVFAANWRTVLAVDAAMGVVVAVVGIVVALVWNPVVGGFVGSLGLVYVILVLRRGRDWARQRREAGLGP